MKIIIEGKDRVVNSLAKQANRSAGVSVEILEGEKVKKVKESKISVDEIKIFLKEKGVKFHAKLGEKKLRILYAENK